MALTLYTYWRSTTSLRVRAALNLKGVAYLMRPVNLLTGDHRAAEYRDVNPSLAVPALRLDDGRVLTQSMAILDWLEEVYPDPALLPADPVERAQVRAAAQVIAMDSHPVNNLRVIQRLNTMGHDADTCAHWTRHWMALGFAAYQAMLPTGGPYSFGESLSQADLCLVGQMVNARRWSLDLTPFARLVDIDAAATDLPQVAAAMPENQPDMVAS
jgi:maleylacetoacetate isomerase/maleylpyruvate isomerase